LALKLAQEPGLLRSIRRKLEQNRLTHPLFDTDRFRRNIEDAYTMMWSTAQRGDPPKALVAGPKNP
jgi:predicted O-linked N-acetylglucosamine transferase (SPINDLY family)